MDALTGAGVYYGAATTEAAACHEQDVIVVGGGNSAGQGAMFLSRYARSVTIAIRSTGLEATMSRYLIDQIAQTPNIRLRPCTEVVARGGFEAAGKRDASRPEFRSAGDRVRRRALHLHRRGAGHRLARRRS